jgi:hypothetical protein
MNDSGDLGPGFENNAAIRGQTLIENGGEMPARFSM